MTRGKGKIVLMGSGELTSTMVEVHKELLADLTPPQHAVFLDTPAGFQLNVDEISKTAVRYFQTRVQHPLSVATFKSADGISSYEAEKAFHTLRNAGFILIGPGSPTYAVRQIRQSPIPDIFCKRIRDGGCLVAASAAALTVGAHALPVYEIYKVGEDVHWVEGINVLASFGFELAVVPHWNNAEGGTHDTRRCFMGEPRFQRLAAMLPETVSILGLDEHTACVIDFSLQRVTVKGIGRVIVRRGEKQQVFTKGQVFPLEVLKGETVDADHGRISLPREAADTQVHSTFWAKMHALEKTFQNGIEERDPGEVTNALLEMDRVIWQGKQDMESDETISEAREQLRDHIVVLGAALTDTPGSERECLAPLVDNLLDLRERFRQQKQFAEADALRESLEQANIRVEDTPEGVRWRTQPSRVRSTPPIEEYPAASGGESSQ